MEELWNMNSLDPDRPVSYLVDLLTKIAIEVLMLDLVALHEWVCRSWI
jgi:hypothetical protein